MVHHLTKCIMQMQFTKSKINISLWILVTEVKGGLT